MLKNYLKIGFRNLAKNKLFSVINISGMAISLASFLIIALYIHDELKFDKHVDDVDLKYRVYTERFNEDGQMTKQSMISPMIAPTLKSEYDQMIDYYVRLMNIGGNVLFETDTKKISETRGAYADTAVFAMFDLTLIEGDPNTALSQPQGLAISKTLAQKYFDAKSALGQSIEVFNQPATVTAVFEDFSPHSHVQFNYFLPMESLNQQIPDRMRRWGWQQFHTYIKMRPGADPNQLEGNLKGFAERNAWPTTKQNGSYYIPHLMKYSDVHLYASDHTWDVAVRGNAQTVYILSATGIFILIIAILNFINLSTARAVSRVKEVGVRKVVGAFRTQLIYQFISESVIIAMISLLIAGLVTELTVPALNSFAEKAIPTGIFLNPLLLGATLLFALLIGIAAGSYPAFYISSFKPASILANRSAGKSGKVFLRKGLVVLQFILSFLLIIAALVVSEQHRYMRTKDMGFDKDNLIVLGIRGEMRRNLEAAKNAFLNHPNVISGTLGYGLPGEAYAGDGVIDRVKNRDWPISMLPVDEDYIKTLNLKLVAGRAFETAGDTANAFVISEAAARMFGYKEPKDALNHPLAWTRWDNGQPKEGKVIGIVKDFHMNSLKENLTPVMMHIFPFGYSTLTLKVKGEDLTATLAHLEAQWRKFNSEWPFEYRFLDDNFDRLYKSEEKLATLFTFFTGFTIFVACLGLFGLVVYSTSQKFKEISIRKVLGAEETGLVVHLSKSYLLLLAISFVIAIPFSYYLADKWLERFPFRIEVTPLLFIKAAAFILLLSLITVGMQSLKAARTNPVEALKQE